MGDTVKARLLRDELSDLPEDSRLVIRVSGVDRGIVHAKVTKHSGDQMGQTYILHFYLQATEEL